MPAGDYYVQAMLVPYTKFSRADGHVIWVHNDQWEGQQFNTSPGNLVSDVQRVHWDPKSRTPVALTLTKSASAGDVPPDTRWVKRIKIKSELLSKFWGQPMYIGATVLLPKGFDEEPTRRYPADLHPGTLRSWARHSASPSRADAETARSQRAGAYARRRRASRDGCSLEIG